jgi:hypothetical protein
MGSLICVAEEHRPLVISAARASRISKVRHDLRELAEHLRDGTELKAAIAIEAWNAVLGRYPASAWNIDTYAEGNAPDLPDQFTEGSLALPLDIAASNDIIGSSLARHPLVRLRREWHQQDKIVEKLLILETLFTRSTRKILPPTSELLTGRLMHFTAEERAQLLVVIEWAIRRVDATCVPRARPNTGKRTTFQWAVGFLDRILVANVVSALWPEHRPARLSSRVVAEIIDALKWEILHVGGNVEIAHVTHVIWLQRQRLAHESKLRLLFSQMEKLNQRNVASNHRLNELRACKFRDQTLHVQNSIDNVKSAIRNNVQKLNEIDSRYSALTASLREVNRRLRSGDYRPPSRATIPRISGHPVKIASLPIG